MKKESNHIQIIIICFVIAFVTSALTSWFTAQTYIRGNHDSYIEMCKNNGQPDEHGCCPGETYTDNGADGFNCCPNDGGDCFPPIK